MSSSHYIRTIHTSFTAAHPNPWAARNAAGPLLSPSSMHSQPLYSTSSPHHQYQLAPSKSQMPSAAPVHHTPASGAGGRRRAYAFRVPSSSSTLNANNGGYGGQPKPKFDPFADEPTSPVPSIAHLASLSTPPTPRLAAASLPAPRQQGYQSGQPRRQQQHHQHQGQGYNNQGFYGGYYGPTSHQNPAPRRSGFPGQRSRSPAPSFVLDSAPLDARSYSSSGPTEVYRSSARAQAWDSQYHSEFEYDMGMGGRGGNGGLMDHRPPQLRVSGPAARRSPSPPQQQPIARRSPSPPSPQQQAYAQSAPRQLARTPSPPTPAPQVRSPAQIQADKDAKARLVAGILLNRIHVPKTTRARRVPSPVGEKRVYRPSGLREVVCVA